MSGRLGLRLGAWLFAVGCGGSAPPPEAPAPSEPAKESANDPVETWSADAEKPSATESEDPGPKADANASSAEPQFTETMSVDEAINAVPRGVERRNVDPETLAKPLQQAEVYEPCKPGSARFKVRVAVWDGRAVGVDVNTTPKNDKLADCIKGRVRELKWEKKVRSLNTIEYEF